MIASTESRSLDFGRSRIGVEVAREDGIAEIEEIERDDDGGWEVEGRDASGKELELEISASGEVTERDD